MSDIRHNPVPPAYQIHRNYVSHPRQIRPRILGIFADLKREYMPLERKALDFFEGVFSRDEVKLEFVMQPGQAVFVNNYEVLHGRRTFIDHPEPQRKRLLLRLQLETGERPLKPEIFIYENRDNQHGIDAQRGKVAATPEFPVSEAS